MIIKKIFYVECVLVQICNLVRGLMTKKIGIRNKKRQNSLKVKYKLKDIW